MLWQCSQIYKNKRFIILTNSLNNIKKLAYLYVIVKELNTEVNIHNII